MRVRSVWVWCGYAHVTTHWGLWLGVVATRVARIVRSAHREGRRLHSLGNSVRQGAKLATNLIELRVVGNLQLERVNLRIGGNAFGAFSRNLVTQVANFIGVHLRGDGGGGVVKTLAELRNEELVFVLRGQHLLADVALAFPQVAFGFTAVIEHGEEVIAVTVATVATTATAAVTTEATSPSTKDAKQQDEQDSTTDDCGGTHAGIRCIAHTNLTWYGESYSPCAFQQFFDFQGTAG